MKIKDIAYVFVSVLVSYLVYVLGVNLITVYALNGAIIGYLYVFFIPIAIHLKCVWYDHSSGFIDGNE